MSEIETQLAQAQQAERDAQTQIAALLDVITPLLGAWGAEDSYDDEMQALADVVQRLPEMAARGEETQLAQAQQALTQSEAQAALLRKAIEDYLADVTIGPETLKAALWETEAGVKIETEIELLKRKLDRYELELERMQQRNNDAWTFIGRIDYALQYEIAQAKDLRSARKWGAKMHAEVNAKVGKP